ncbi:hypothetical protein [Rodentibacter trehalosifermentans]
MHVKNQNFLSFVLTSSKFILFGFFSVSNKYKPSPTNKIKKVIP